MDSDSDDEDYVSTSAEVSQMQELVKLDMAEQRREEVSKRKMRNSLRVYMLYFTLFIMLFMRILDTKQAYYMGDNLRGKIIQL